MFLENVKILEKTPISWVLGALNKASTRLSEFTAERPSYNQVRVRVWLTLKISSIQGFLLVEFYQESKTLCC